MKKIDNDTIWTWIITIAMISFFLIMGFVTNAQPIKRDTILHNQFRDYVEWSKQQHKKTLEDFEGEKYQMIYFDKAIIDRKHHRIYLYSSYDLYWAEELGAGWQITIPHRKPKGGRGEQTRRLRKNF